MLELFDKNKRGNMDFLDLLIHAVALASKSKDVRDDLKRRYRYLFIDEFQDTDPVQAYLCSFICEKAEAFAQEFHEVELEKGKLFIVGDPRQSIYRFRRADPQMHFSMIGLIRESGGARKSLPANYRSTPSLVTFYNTFFHTLFGRGSDYSFPYGEPLEPGRMAESPSPSVCFYSLDKDVEREGFLASLLKGIKNSPFEIEEEGTKRPVAWRDMTILYVGDFGKKVLSPLREKMNEAGIPLLMPSLKGFYDQEVKDLLFLLESICDPANRTALYGALKSTIFGFTDSQLGGYFAGKVLPPPDLAEALAMIDRWISLRDTVGVHELISVILEDCGYEYSALLFPDGQRIFFNVEKLLIIAREFDQKYSSSLRDFTGFLRQQIRVAAEEGEIPYFEEGEDAVRIMSVHSAKGLEFPIVIYYLTGEFARRDPGPILYDRVRGSFGITQHNFSTPSCFQMVEDRIEEKGVTRKELIPFLMLEQRKAAAESLRLSYVAMTRARDLLVLVSQPPGPGVMRKNIIAKKLISFLEPYDALESACPFTAIPGETRNIQESLKVFSGQISKGGRKSKATSPRPRKPEIPVLEECEREPEKQILSKGGEKIAQEEEGFRFGNTVHKILEALPPFEAELFEEAGRLSRIFFESDEERDRFLRIVERMKKSAVLEKFRGWKLLGTEVPISADWGEGAGREAADLVLIEGRRLLVIDYKTGVRSVEKNIQAKEQVSRYVQSIEKSTETEVSGLIWYIEEDEWLEIPTNRGTDKWKGEL
jgi:ATP-dependent exoDNAse (exonuclease V) beta subunit